MIAPAFCNIAWYKEKVYRIPGNKYFWYWLAVKKSFLVDESMVLAEAKGIFLPFTPEMVDTILKDYPGLREFFEQ